MRIPTSFRVIAIVLIALVLVLASCAKTAPTPTQTTTSPPAPTATASPTPRTTAAPAPTATASPTPTARPTTTATTAVPPASAAKPVGSLTATLSSFGSDIMDPVRTGNSTVSAILSPMFDSLIMGDNKGNLVPGVADKWEMAPDGLSWTIFVHKGIKFSNGDDLKAADVKFTLDRQISKEAFNANLRAAVAKSEIIDDYTVKVVTNGVQVFLPPLISIFPQQQGLILPKNYIEKNGLDNFAKNPVGSGPFKLIRRTPGDSIEYEAMDQHWKQTASFKNLTIILVPEEFTRVAMLKTGSADVVEAGLDQGIALRASGFQIVPSDVHSPYIEFNGTNTTEGAKSPIANLKVRQALNMAINRDELSKTLFAGTATPALAGLSATLQGVDMTWLADFSAKLYKYDQAQAKQLLKDAGYPSGFDLGLYSTQQVGASYQSQLTQAVAGYWKAIGINVNLIPIDWGALSPLFNQPDPRLVGKVTLLRNTANPNPLTNLQLFFSDKGRHHLMEGTRPDLNDLFAKSSGQPDATKRGALIQELIQQVSATSLVLALPNIPIGFAVGPRVDLTDKSVPWPASGFGFIAAFAKHN